MRITHVPTGIVVSMQDEKSQLQNREKAMRVLRARLYEQKLAAQQAEIASERRSQVGSGERSEKIRTYNFPQGRVTDHRIKLTAHNLDEVLAGNLREFTDALAAEEKRAAPGGADGRSGVLMTRRRRPARCARRSRRRATRFAAAGVDSPRLDAELLLAEATGSDRAQLAAEPDAAVDAGRRAPVRRDGAAPGPPRAGRLHRRPQGLSPPRARGRLRAP